MAFLFVMLVVAIFIITMLISYIIVHYIELFPLCLNTHFTDNKTPVFGRYKFQNIESFMVGTKCISNLVPTIYFVNTFPIVEYSRAAISNILSSYTGYLYLDVFSQ